MKDRRILLVILAVLCLGFAPRPIFAQVQDTLSAEYRIGPQDLLEISVFGLEALNKTVRVSEDGKIALPLIGEVLVDDMTKSEVEKKLSALLKEKVPSGSPGFGVYPRIPEQEGLSDRRGQDPRALMTSSAARRSSRSSPRREASPAKPETRSS